LGRRPVPPLRQPELQLSRRMGDDAGLFARARRSRRLRKQLGGQGGVLIRWSLAVLVGLLAGLWTAQRAGDPTLYPPQEGRGAIVVHLLDNGFHTDRAAPRAALAAGDDALARAVRALPPGDWVRIGWGDAVF